MSKRKMDPVTLLKMRGLATVIDDLLIDDRARLDMDFWGWAFHKQYGDVLRLYLLPDSDKDEQWKNPHCKTVCCLAGWATMAPYMRQLRIPADPALVNDWIAGDNDVLYECIIDMFISSNLASKRETLIALRDELNEISAEFGGPEQLEPFGEYEDIEKEMTNDR